LPYYYFSFKKGDAFVELESDNVAFISGQFESWFKKITGINLSKTNNLNKELKQKVETKLNQINKPEESSATVEIKQAPESIVIETPQTDIIETADEIVLNVADVKPQISISEALPKETEAPPVKETVALSDIVEKEIQEKITVENIVEPQEIVEPTTEPKEGKFYDILQEKFSQLPEMVTESLDKKLVKNETKTTGESVSLDELIKIKTPETLMDYLLVAAYYLKHNENLDRYSLKQINAKVFPYTKKAIDHSVIQEAVTNNYFEVIPDFTEVVGVTEYAITKQGEDYFINVL